MLEVCWTFAESCKLPIKYTFVRLSESVMGGVMHAAQPIASQQHSFTECDHGGKMMGGRHFGYRHVLD